MLIIRKKVPLMTGWEANVMRLFNKQIRQIRGLVTVLDRSAGINCKWFNSEEPFDINATKIVRATAYYVLICNKDELIANVIAFKAHIEKNKERYGLDSDKTRKKYKNYGKKHQS